MTTPIYNEVCRLAINNGDSLPAPQDMRPEQLEEAQKEGIRQAIVPALFAFGIVPSERNPFGQKEIGQ